MYVNAGMPHSVDQTQFQSGAADASQSNTSTYLIQDLQALTDAVARVGQGSGAAPVFDAAGAAYSRTVRGMSPKQRGEFNQWLRKVSTPQGMENWRRYRAMDPEDRKEFSQWAQKVSTPQGMENWRRYMAERREDTNDSAAGNSSSRDSQNSTGGGRTDSGSHGSKVEPFDLGNPHQTLMNMMNIAMVGQMTDQTIAKMQLINQQFATPAS